LFEPLIILYDRGKSKLRIKGVVLMQFLMLNSLVKKSISWIFDRPGTGFLSFKSIEGHFNSRA